MLCAPSVARRQVVMVVGAEAQCLFSADSLRSSNIRVAVVVVVEVVVVAAVVVVAVVAAVVVVDIVVVISQ